MIDGRWKGNKNLTSTKRIASLTGSILLGVINGTETLPTTSKRRLPQPGLFAGR